jgi:rare lipoprotein A
MSPTASFFDPWQYASRWFIAAAVAALTVAGCGALPHKSSTGLFEPADGPPPRALDADAIAEVVPRVEPLSRYGNPATYEVFGQRYQVMSSSAGYVERGIASWYGSKFHGRRTSSGEPFDMYAVSAAHTTLPLPTYAEVTNLANGRAIIVKINDRGPFKHNRLIDLSYAAAVKLGIAQQGTGMVEVRAIDPVNWQANATRLAAADTGKAGAIPGLYLQIGAFSQMENAARLRSRLEDAAHGGVHVVPAGDGRAPLYRVRIGPLPNVDEADRVSRELLAMGLDTHIVLD